MSFFFVVRGRTTHKPAGPWWNRSTEITRQGRWPACSCPRVGFRSASQVSARAIGGTASGPPPGHPTEWRPTPFVRGVRAPTLWGSFGGPHTNDLRLPGVAGRHIPGWLFRGRLEVKCRPALPVCVRSRGTWCSRGGRSTQEPPPSSVPDCGAAHLTGAKTGAWRQAVPTGRRIIRPLPYLPAAVSTEESLQAECGCHAQAR